MKRLFGYALMLALAAAPAMAAKNSQSFNLGQNVKVGTTDIPAGNVKVTWTGTGDAVQVTLSSSGKSITVPAKLISEKNVHKGYVVSNKSGVDELQTIQLNDLSLQLQSGTSSGQ
jgi:opacity protein-like surface antigen